MTNRSRTSGWSILFLGLALSLAVACQSQPKVETHVEERPDGVIVVETIRTQATVTAIDATNRTLTLKRRRGRAKTFKVGEHVVNFEQIRVGDEVHAMVIEELAVTLVSGGAPLATDGAAAVALAPEGDKPAIIMADTIETTAKVVAIDGHDHTVTLEFEDGSIEEVDVPKHRDLSKVGLGDSVRIRLTEALAVAIVRPE